LLRCGHAFPERAYALPSSRHFLKGGLRTRSVLQRRHSASLFRYRVEEEKRCRKLNGPPASSAWGTLRAVASSQSIDLTSPRVLSRELWALWGLFLDGDYFFAVPLPGRGILSTVVVAGR
jgi:hypothetical protein